MSYLLNMLSVFIRINANIYAQEFRKYFSAMFCGNIDSFNNVFVIFTEIEPKYDY